MTQVLRTGNDWRRFFTSFDSMFRVMMMCVDILHKNGCTAANAYTKKDC